MALVNTTTSMLFDGIGDRLNAGASLAVRSPMGNTVGKGGFCGWFRSTDIGPAGIICGLFDTGTQHQAFIRMNGAVGLIQAVCKKGNGVAGTISVFGTFNDDVWRNVIIIVDGASFHFYIDGVFQATGACVGSNSSGTPTYSIVGVPGSSQFSNSKITQVTSWHSHTAVNATLATDLYNGGFPVDPTTVAGIGTNTSWFELPNVVPPTVTTDFNTDRLAIQGALTATGILASDAVLDFPAAVVSTRGIIQPIVDPIIDKAITRIF